MFNTGKIKDLQNRISELESEIQLAIQFVNSIKQNEKQVEYLSALKQKQTLLSNALLDMYEQMHQLSEQEEQRNWAIRGSAKFGEILRANQDNLKNLAQAIISNLVKFLEGVQGGFFLLNEDEPQKPYLELMACYAYERRKYTQRKIPIDAEFAEGLIGQTFLEKETLILNNLPESYTYIKSGLGETTPKNLVIIPLKLNDAIYGVIEIVSLQVFLPYEIDFLEKLAESISSSIANVKINETTKKLLEETQQQAEALKAQEEEMRQNNEELMATQEEMLRRGNELDGQLHAINNSPIIKVELSLEGEIENINPFFEQLFKYQASEVIGKHHHQLLNPDFANSPEYTAFWKNLLSGKTFVGEVQRFAQDGTEIWLNSTYSPVYNSDNYIFKIIQLGFDVTAAKHQMNEIKKQSERMAVQEKIMLKNREELKQKIKELEHLKSNANVNGGG